MLTCLQVSDANLAQMPGYRQRLEVLRRLQYVGPDDSVEVKVRSNAQSKGITCFFSCESGSRSGWFALQEPRSSGSCRITAMPAHVCMQPPLLHVYNCRSLARDSPDG